MENLIRLCAVTGILWISGAGLRFSQAEIPPQHTDSEILGVMSMIDQNEIKAAQLAEQKNIDPQILDYARTLDEEHNKHLDETRQLSQELGLTITDNVSLDHIHNQGVEELNALAPLNGSAFAQLYIADMIKGHSDALNWIQSQDTPNPPVKKFLQETQNVITMHLENAQKIQQHQAIGQS